MYTSVKVGRGGEINVESQDLMGMCLETNCGKNCQKEWVGM